MGDEKRARHQLADMQARIARGAYDALGITSGDVGADHVRASFLELAKTYHPAKFARMPVDIQKLANEVFLGLRAAHDQLARPKTAPVRQSQQVAILSSKTPAPELVRPPTNPAPVRPSSPAITPRPNVPPAPTSAINPATQRGVPPAPTGALNPPTQRGAAPAPVTTPRRAPTAPIPVQPRPHTIARAGTQPVRRATPAGGVAVPPSGPRPAVTPSGGVPGAEPELAGVYELLQKGQWEAARTTLNALIALQPRPRYRALLQYSLGREAQLSRRLDEARVELQNALEIDPELQLAKTALAELFTRRK